jgi:cellulose synthase/poly-beta-1,6-N-acetylglucosamine synthase-like glycosyltransferase
VSGVDVVALLVALPPSLLLAIFAAEVAAGLRPLAGPREEGATPRTTVLIPAHNEAAGIAAMIAALREADPAIDLLVVADNCIDDTAARARLAGARVVERVDPTRRGKGYALAFGRDALATAPPACVVVLDADCTVEGKGVAALARAAIGADRAVQARYLQRPNRTAPVTAQISNFAFLVKNLVRQRGMVRLGGVAALTGTGMAFPWRRFADAPLASADLAEDLALGAWLTRVGNPPYLDETAHVWSDAASGKSLMIQRNRWERGFIAIARRQALPLIAKGVLGGARSRLWLGLHLIVPPLALLFAGAGAALVLTASLILVGASLWAPLLLAVALLCASLATTAAWRVEGRAWISGRTLLHAPLYVAAKLPLYRTLLSRGGDGWVRTRRAGETNPID